MEQLQIESLDKLPNGDMYILKPKDGAGSIGMEFVTKDEFGLLLGIEENDKIKCKVKFRNYTKNGLLRIPSFFEYIS